MINSHIKKIIIVGCAGSGKTTLAFKLHQKLKLPIIHLDQYYWKKDWQRCNLDEFTQIHDTLCLQDSWIMEGAYIKLLSKRAEHADLIIFLDIPRYLCLWRVIKRTVFNLGNVIPGSPDCPQELLSWNFVYFLQWIWNFNQRYKNMIMDVLYEYKNSKNVYILKSSKEIDTFYKKL